MDETYLPINLLLKMNTRAFLRPPAVCVCPLGGPPSASSGWLVQNWYSLHPPPQHDVRRRRLAGCGVGFMLFLSKILFFSFLGGPARDYVVWRRDDPARCHGRDRQQLADRSRPAI